MNNNIESILPNRDFPEYSAFSANVNPRYFHFALPFITEYVKNENEFDILFKELECFMKTGKLINKDSILGFFKTEPEKYLYYNS